MGLIKRIKRCRYVYGWRLRYWWLDTPAGHHARVSLMILGFLGGVAEIVHMVIESSRPVTPQHPRESLNWFIAILFGIAVALIGGLKEKKTKTDDQQQAPTTDDGQSVPRHYGTCWVDDSFLLAWKIVKRKKIKASGGK